MRRYIGRIRFINNRTSGTRRIIHPACRIGFCKPDCGCINHVFGLGGCGYGDGLLKGFVDKKVARDMDGGQWIGRTKAVVLCTGKGEKGSKQNNKDQ